MPCENITGCYDCVGNCQRCPIECQFISVYNENKKKINKTVMLPSSQYLNIKKGMITSRHVGQSANPKKLLQTGGPGDLITSVERRGRKPKDVANINLNELTKVTYNMGRLRNRTSSNGKTGVDKKHGSYARFLARKIGGVLRKEKMPHVLKKTAYIHQPRNRTNTSVSCKLAPTTKTKQFFPLGRYGNTVSNISFSNCYSNKCCSTRIPQITENCRLTIDDAHKWNSGSRIITGACGNNSQCVPTSCRCCHN